MRRMWNVCEPEKDPCESGVISGEWEEKRWADRWRGEGRDGGRWRNGERWRGEGMGRRRDREAGDLERVGLKDGGREREGIGERRKRRDEV